MTLPAGETTNDAAVVNDARTGLGRISIVSINYAPEPTGISVYTTGLAEYLAAQGAEVVVHTGFPYYPAWKKRPEDRGRLFASERVKGVTLRRCYLYVPARPRAITRIVHEATFVASAVLSYLFQRRPDVTIVVTPPLPAALPILLIARLRGSRSIVHVQDLQPDAALDLGMLKPGVFARTLFAIERWTYRAAHVVSTISFGMMGRIASKGVPTEKLIMLRNWADDDLVRPLPRETRYRSDWGLDGKFVVLYSGNLGRKQGLGSLLDAAGALRDRPDIAVVIVGDGAERADLEAAAASAGLTNVQFRPLQPMEALPELLATSDVSVIPQVANIEHLVLPSKLGNMLASARPAVVAAGPGSDLAMMIEAGDCGIVVSPGDGEALARAVLRLADDPEECARLGRNARQTMERQLSKAAVLGEFQRWLRALRRGRRSRERA
jgi:colanic acid biosynthesis glycosyl transferase WcaI